MRLLSHPFRLEGARVATVEQGSVESDTELVAKLMLTKRGERPLVPMYGCLDPAFDHYDLNDVQFGVTLFGPNVEIVSLTATYLDDHTQSVAVEFR